MSIDTKEGGRGHMALHKGCCNTGNMPPSSSDRLLPASTSLVDDGRVFSFGDFRFDWSRRLLFDSGQPVALGSRALEILATLIEVPGVLVSKQELMSRVWPRTVVEEINLRVQVAALRKALAKGESNPIATVPGQGYRFTRRPPVFSSTGLWSPGLI